MADRLKLKQGQGVSALADGAGWIWTQMREHLPDHEGVLDVYHLLEHLHAAGRALHGEGPAAQRWARQSRAALFRLGVKRYLHQQLLPLAKAHRRRQPDSAAAEGLRRLLSYRDRLRRGLPIGSGQVEGLCKNTLNRRLRLNNARWLTDNADRMAALACLHYSQLWDRFWTQPASAAA
jgi:hypothetical protein